MKKISLCVFASLLMLAVIPAHLIGKNEVDPVTIEATAPSEAEQIGILNARLIEIQELDRSGMTRQERRALRVEVRAIKGELKSYGDGIYLSVGALILVIVLLILLL